MTVMTKGKSRPILFSAPMIRALVAGIKTQTRRAMRVQPDEDAIVTVEHYHPTVIDKQGDEHPGAEIFGAVWNDGESGLKCPYGAPGDKLWVRESWQAWCDFDGVPPRDIPLGSAVQYPATYDGWVSKKRPGMFMPRWASRITLEVTGVRVERLHDISEADARAEGSPCIDEVSGREVLFPDHSKCGTFKLGYRYVWESINGAGSWDANPWVWCVEFAKVES